MFILPFKDVEALGAYNLAVRASIVPNLVSVALVTSLFPKLSEMHSKLGIQSLRDAFKTSTRYAALLGFPVSLLVATLAYPIFILFATVRFVDAVIPLAVMCIASLPTILGLAISPILYTLKQTKLASVTIMVSILIEATLSYIFLAYLNAGLVAVAFTRLIATICQLILGSYLLNRILTITYDREAIWKSALAAVFMVMSLLGLEAFRSVIEPASFQFLVLRLRLLPVYTIVGIVVYLLSLFLLKAVMRRDIELVRDYVPSRLQWIVELFGRIIKAE
jgi:O-antigen/teichoic acid export membrane protein